jgi:hypothetical protein
VKLKKIPDFVSSNVHVYSKNKFCSNSFKYQHNAIFPYKQSEQKDFNINYRELSVCHMYYFRPAKRRQDAVARNVEFYEVFYHRLYTCCEVH